MRNISIMNKVIRIISSILLSCMLAVTSIIPAMASPVPWPQSSGVEAEGAILIDARSGVILYGKNIHESYYPASITKILTALLVIENCPDLDETLTFSHRAIYDVEAGSSNAGYSEGDTTTVRDALYALLLASANEAANALAEHVAGSIEDFCVMMNERAEKLGCTDTHFANPSGLNNEDHYTSAYDYALICMEAFNNDIFVQIDGTTFHHLPPMERAPEGQTVYAHHSMMKRNNAQYYEGIIGGKTGYTTLAGNTLVTCAEREGLRLITVVLNGHQTHYDDTKKLLDFGFENFKSVPLCDYDTKYSTVLDDMDITGLGNEGDHVIYPDPEATITLPKNGDFQDVNMELLYDLDVRAPEDACAVIKCTYGENVVGNQYVMREFAYGETSVTMGELVEEEEETEEETQSAAAIARDKFLDSSIWIKIAVIAGAVAVIAGIVILIVHLISKHNKKKKEFRMTGGFTGSSRSGRSRSKKH